MNGGLRSDGAPMQLWCSAVGHPPASGWGQLLQVKRQRGGSQAVDPWGRARQARRLLGPIGSGGAGFRPRRGRRRYAWGGYQVPPADGSVPIAISTAVTWDPRSHGIPTGSLAGPGSGKRQHGQRRPGAWDALRFGFPMRASEPEHCRRVEIVVSMLPGLPGTVPGIRCLAFQARHGPAGWRAVSDGRLWPDIAPRSAGTRFLDRQDVEMWGIGLRTGGVGNGMLVCVKGPGITERSDRVIDLQIFTDADVPGTAFGEPFCRIYHCRSEP